MPPCTIITEEEIPHGWRYDVEVVAGNGERRSLHLTLSWSDYNHWSATGADEPAAVALAVVRFLLSRSPVAELREKLDASLARRLYDDADEVIPGLI